MRVEHKVIFKEGDDKDDALELSSTLIDLLLQEDMVLSHSINTTKNGVIVSWATEEDIEDVILRLKNGE